MQKKVLNYPPWNVSELFSIFLSMLIFSAFYVSSVTKLTTLDSTSSERGDKTEKAEDVIKSSDKVVPSTASTTLNAPLHFASAASTSASLSNGFSNSIQFNGTNQQQTTSMLLLKFDDIECPVMFSLTWSKYKTKNLMVQILTTNRVNGP